MKVGMITDQIDKNPNTGPSIYLCELILHLLRIKDDVELYLIHSQPNSNPIYTLSEINEVVLPQKPNRALNILRKLKLDILHLNYLPKLREFWIFKVKSNIVVTVHGDEVWTIPQYVPAEKWLIYWRRTLDFITARFVKRLIAVSNSLKWRLVRNLRIPPEKIDIVYNGVNHELFKPLKVNQNIFNDKGWNLEVGKYILHVSNYAPMKNAETLIEAFDLLANDYPDIKLVIAGGRWDNKLRELGVVGRRDILYLGKVSETDLSLLYNGAICFVSPSLHETFGLTFVEAMACGCPVIGSRLTSIPEIVSSAGILLKNPKDKYELYKEMVKILENPNLRRTLSRKGIYRSKMFDWHETARGVYNVYKRTILNEHL